MEISTDLPTLCGERPWYLAEGTKTSISSYDASDVHPEWSGLPTASSFSCLHWHILWVRSSAHNQTMEAVATVMMHLAKLAASSAPLRAPQTAFRQLPVLVWRCTKPVRQVDQICTVVPNIWGSSAWNWLRVSDPFWRLELGVSGYIFRRLAHRSYW
jgi:hypothetical protein